MGNAVRGKTQFHRAIAGCEVAAGTAYSQPCLFHAPYDIEGGRAG
jgi:hypothetical protein